MLGSKEMAFNSLIFLFLNLLIGKYDRLIINDSRGPLRNINLRDAMQHVIKPIGSGII